MILKKVLIVDDHVVIRTGLKAVFFDLFPEVTVLEAEDGDGALKILKQQHVDVLVLDLQMPNTESISLIELFSIKFPETYILAFTMLPEKIYAKRIMKAGASGYLPKDAGYEEMKRAFSLALQQKKYFSPFLTEMLSAESAKTEGANAFESLSYREFEILNLLLTGNNVSSIARMLNIKSSTVGTYKNRIFQKMQVQTLLDLQELASINNFKASQVKSSVMGNLA